MHLRHAHSKVAILIAVLLAAVMVHAPIVIAQTNQAQTNRASTVINEMIAALGGKAFLEVREIQASGNLFTFSRNRMAGTQAFVRYIKFPDKERIEYGSDRIKPTTINNGDDGWTVYDKKIDPLPPADTKEFPTGFKSNFRYLARFVLNRPGLALQLANSELIDYKRNDVIEFREFGHFFRLYIDQQSHLPSKLQVRRAGESFIREEQLANWHVFQGIQTPLYTIHFRDGEKTMEVRYQNVSYNSGLADSLFAPPVPSAPAAAR